MAKILQFPDNRRTLKGKVLMRPQPLVIKNNKKRG